MSDLTETLIRRLSVGGAPATIEEYEALAAEFGLDKLPEYIDIPVGECGGKIRVDYPAHEDASVSPDLFPDVEVTEPKSEVDTAGNGG